MARVTLAPVVSPIDRLALAGITVVLCLAGLGALLALPQQGQHRASRSTDAAASASPLAALPRAKDGRVLRYFPDAGFLGVVVDRTKRSVLHIVIARGTRIIDCNVLRPRARVVVQDAIAVRLVVSGYEYVPKAAARVGGTTCVSSGSQAIDIRLRAPLGDRRVYDGGQPEATPVADPADFPEPRVLPAGYTPDRTAPVVPTLERLVAERAYAKGVNRLLVRVGSRYDVVAAGRETKDTTVDGSYAVVTERSDERCVTWNELSGRVRQVCAKGAKGAEPLTGSTLLRVARSLN